MSVTTTTTEPPRITAENVATLFPEVDTSLAREVLPKADGNPSAASSNELAGYDDEQVRLMDEVCIVLDDDDKPIGSASKKTCKIIPLHDYSSGLQCGFPASVLPLPLSANTVY
ncbi:unnamed protein product [Aspergillus oryzae]|nr:unnamed protein product [Aspergillus oryzae]GMF96714.1 unnamed protein product [Aspergillus oryzae]GMG11448.1 unnamed protein product [Aspergillus oryzae]